MFEPRYGNNFEPRESHVHPADVDYSRGKEFEKKRKPYLHTIDNSFLRNTILLGMFVGVAAFNGWIGYKIFTKIDQYSVKREQAIERASIIVKETDDAPIATQAVTAVSIDSLTNALLPLYSQQEIAALTGMDRMRAEYKNWARTQSVVSVTNNVPSR